MKQRLLFEGELSDVTLENVFPTLISKAVETDDDVFLRWNGATIRVEPTDTIGTLMQKYDKEIRLVGLANKMDMPIDGRDKHLYRIKNRLAEFYIVAHSFDEAADEMKKRRDKKILDLKLQYIEEHQPMPLKRFQRIKVTARVTEESRKRMTSDARKMKKNALGATYTIIGVFNGYRIDDAGHVVPCFYGEGEYRGWYDEILSVELTADQPEGSCNKCQRAKDGFCYMAGGKDIGTKYAVWKIEEDKMVPCPKYEEVVEGGLYAIKNKIWPARYYPKVTRVRTTGDKWKYRLYDGEYCFCEYDERHIKQCYTHEPQNYDEDK